MTHQLSAAWPRRLVSAFTAALFLLTAGACNGGSGDASSSTTRSSTTNPPEVSSTATSTDDMTEQIVAGYTASSEAFIEAAAIPDPNYPALAATHTGPMFDQRRNVLLALQADGRIIRYPPDSKYRVDVDRDSMDVDGDTAVFEACGVDDGERVIAATGEVIAAGVVTVQIRVAMRRVDGVWKLAERQQLGEWEGVAGCAVG